MEPQAAEQNMSRPVQIHQERYSYSAQEFSFPKWQDWSEYLEKQENRFGGRAAKTSQSFQDHQRHSYDNRPNRASDISYKRRTLKKPDHLAHGDGVASHTPTRNIRGARRSVHHVGDQHRVYGSDGATSYPAHSPRTDTSPSLHSFLSQEKTLQLADDKATERRASRSEQQRRSEIDFVGNSRYGINDNKRQQDPEDTEPLRLPYTTPASEFLYGHSVVTAALRARRRKLYKMYIYQSAKRGDEKKDLDMRKMALDLDVPVERVSFDRVRMLDRMSEGRPHNGFVLEASPLPKLPVTGFDRVTQPGGHFLSFLDHQSREDEAINGIDPRIRYHSPFARFPFVLLLDGILDPQNLGAVLRSAFFLGVDAIIITVNRTAPLSPVALKASAGASEGITILTVNQTRPFLDACKSNGWKVYASTADPTYGDKKDAKHRHLTNSTFISDVSRRPCILILGSEGQGLYKDVQGAAHNTISIEGPRQGEMGIDSLNVSVAAGLLCETFLRKPATMNEVLQDFDEPDAVGLHVRDRLF